MSDAQEDPGQPVLTYRFGADDHPPKDLWRGWALARAWFYTVLFASVFVLLSVVFVSALMDGARAEWQPMLTASSALTLFGMMTFLSVRSLWMICTRRAAHPFDLGKKAEPGPPRR